MRTTLVFFLIILTLLAACGGRAATTSIPATPTAAPNPTASPTATMPLAILVLPADMAQQDKDSYQTLIYGLTQANGMRFQVLNSLTADDLALVGPALKVVIAFPPDPGLAALTAAAPGVQFLAVDIPNLATAHNLSSIGANGFPVDQQAFLAGYIAGLVAPEWKVGILSQKDNPSGDIAVTAFTNGFVYYCGSCRNPLFPQPAGIYPVIVRIPSDAKPGEYTAYADLLIQNVVKVAYVFPDVATSDLLSYMSQKNLLLVGQSLPSQTLAPQWIASIQPDEITAIKNIFPQLVAGKGGQVVPTPLILADVNSNLLSAGKLRLAQDVLDGLQNGTIGTGVSP
ncbi:MAG: hypothetical protein ABSA23_00330 [Anaerolineales bacterium]